MLRIRTTKLSSGHISVQVVHRHHHRTDILKHIGTAADTQEMDQLIRYANQYIATQRQIPPLLPEVFVPPSEASLVTSSGSSLVSLDHLVFTASYHHFAYEFLSAFYLLNGFDKIQNSLLKDLALMRIIEPCSKLRSVALLKEYFSISYPLNHVYEGLRGIKTLQESVEQVAVTYAKSNLGFDFSLVFYDVTTLYFETFAADEDIKDETGTMVTTGLRKPGFSKDNKPQQPQVMIGLLVTTEGYPIAVQTFSGKTFEGHTIIPVITALQERYGIEKLTVVADAGMLSEDNIVALAEAKLHYIVGARLGSISETMLAEISHTLQKTEALYSTTDTPRGTLICDYSIKRATKDRSDRKKQLQRAQYQIDHPDKVKKKARFVTEETKASLTLNNDLIAKDELKEGLKGYYTNLTLSPELTADHIIQRYKDLWHVEKSFRITKSDLQARPIFHRKRDSVEAHITIVFVALCLAKSIELTTGYSIKQARDMIWRITDAKLRDTLTNTTFTKRMDTTGNKMAEFLEKFTAGDI